MSDGQSTATINYEDRGEAIRYRGEGRELVAECTHGHGTRLFADSVKRWHYPPAELTDAERLLVLSELLVWMSRPGFFRRLFRQLRREIILVVDEKDPLRSVLLALPKQFSHAGVRVIIETDSEQKRNEVRDSIINTALKNGRGKVVVNGRMISSLEDYRALGQPQNGIAEVRLSDKDKI